MGDVEGLEFALQLVSATEPPRPGPGTIELFAPYPLSDEGNMRRLASTTPELERFVTKVNQLGVDPGASDAVASGPAAQVSGDASATSRSSSATINSLHSSTVVSVTRSVITPESNVCVFEFSEARSPVALPGPSPGLDSEPLVPGVIVVCCGTSVGDMAGLQPVLTLDNCCVSATPSSLAFDVLQAVVVCTEGICVTATVAMVSNWLATALGDAKGSILANQVLVYAATQPANVSFRNSCGVARVCAWVVQAVLGRVLATRRGGRSQGPKPDEGPVGEHPAVSSFIQLLAPLLQLRPLSTSRQRKPDEKYGAP